MQIGKPLCFEGNGNSGHAELCCNAESTGEVDALLKELDVQLSEIPRQALFLASKAHVAHRKQGGSRTTGLPDFFIGAHAQVLGLAILTRDPGRYKTYFPDLPLICP
jgi:predicted nucleic acid-binding protein